jgi:hypothetical protein
MAATGLHSSWARAADAPGGANTLKPVTADPAVLAVGDTGTAKTRITNDLGVDLTLEPRLEDVPRDTVVAAGNPPTVPDAPVASDATIPLPAAASVEITVTPPAKGKLPEKAQLALVVRPSHALPAGYVTRLPLQAASSSPAAPSVKSWTTTARFVPWSDTDRKSHTRIPLDNSGSCKDLDLSRKKQVGVLEADGQYVRVTASCVKEGSDLFARLSISHAANDGLEYKGTVDLDPSNDTKGAVDLTFRRTARLWWFLFLLLVGLGLAYVVRWWTASAAKVTQQLRRVDRLLWAVSDKNANSVVKQFRQIIERHNVDGTAKDWNFADNVRQEADTLATDLKSLRKLSRPIGANSQQFKDVDTRLTLVESVVKAWPDVANDLVKLDAVMTRLESLPRIDESVQRDTLYRTDLVVKIDDVAALKTSIKFGLDVATLWPDEAYLRINGDYERLSQIRDNTDPLFRERKADAARAWGELEAGRQEASDLDSVRDLRGLLFEAAGQIDTALKVNDERLTKEALDLLEAQAGGPGGVAVPTPDAISDPFERDAWVRRGQKLVDRLVFIALLFALIVAAYAALYSGKAYGGWADYLATVAWGLGAGALLEPIVALIDSAGERSAFRLDAWT